MIYKEKNIKLNLSLINLHYNNIIINNGWYRQVADKEHVFYPFLSWELW